MHPGPNPERRLRTCASCNRIACQAPRARCIADALHEAAVQATPQTLSKNCLQPLSRLLLSAGCCSLCLLPFPLTGADTSPELRKVFCSYCQFTRGVSRMLISQTEMVTQQLHKMCLDIGILGEGGARGAGDSTLPPGCGFSGCASLHVLS